MTSGILVAIAYTYSYAQVAYLRCAPGEPAWPEAELVLVTLAAYVSFASLFELGRRFGVRGPPAQDVLSLEPGEWGKGLAGPRGPPCPAPRRPLERSIHVLRTADKSCAIYSGSFAA